MKIFRALPYFAAFCINYSLFAHASDVKDTNTIEHQNGVYAGLGLVSSNDAYHFELNSWAEPEPSYIITKYKRNKMNYSGQLILGYQIVDPMFVALEVNYTINKDSIHKRYDDTELPGGTALGHSADLSMKYGNDIALKLKIGKSLFVRLGNACRNVTPYVLFGIHKRNLMAAFDYPSISADLNAVVRGALDNFSYANQKINSKRIHIIGGIGANIALEKGTFICFEYNCSHTKSAHIQKTLQHPASVANHLDTEGQARHYSLKGKNTHTISVSVNKNI